ncbi:MAG: hypothetical protein O3B86_19655, partial [Planctomycetota bacterium]|nr:hypothetical protein [Planctomycetota bacterium]
MSDSSGSSSSKPRPGSDRRRAGGTTRQADGRRTTGKRARPKVAPLIRVIDDGAGQKLSPVELLKREVRTGLPGIAVSTVLHAIILLVMALIVFRLDVDTEGPLSFGWRTDAAKTEIKTTAMAPVKIQSFQLEQNTTQKPAEIPAPEQAPVAKIARQVKPADVAQSLALRKPKRRTGTVGGTGTKTSVEQSIRTGLEWLRRQQKSGGNWQL